MVTVKLYTLHQNLGGLDASDLFPTCVVPATRTWGEHIAAVIAKNPDMKDGFLANSFTLNQKPLSLSLRDPIGEDSNVYILGYGRWTQQLTLPFAYYESGKKWPPCDNYGGQEPLNMCTIGYTGTQCNCEHCLKGDYDKKYDNRDANIVVLAYRNSSARTGVNKFMYGTALLTKKQSSGAAGYEDPLTRLPISAATALAIVKGGDFSEVLIG